MKRKLLILIFTIIAVIAVGGAVTACSPKSDDSDSSADLIFLPISSDGEIIGYSVKGRDGLSGDVVIPEVYNGKAVISIEQNAFARKMITAISIPDTITSIGDNAFALCDKLKEINLPDTVTSIGNQIFSGCIGLEKVSVPLCISNNQRQHFEAYFSASQSVGMSNYIPKKLSTVRISAESIPTGYFGWCDGLLSVVLADSVKYVEPYAFEYCKRLALYCEAESLPDGWDFRWRDHEDDYDYIIPVIWDCKNNNADENGCLYATVNYIRYKISGDTASVASTPYLPSMDRIIPESIEYCGVNYQVTAIDDNAFRYSDEAVGYTFKVEIPNTVTRIGDYAIYDYDGLESITIPASVTHIGKSFLSYCDQLKEITVQNGNPVYHSENGCIYETSTNTLICGTRGCTVSNQARISADIDGGFLGNYSGYGDYEYQNLKYWGNDDNKYEVVSGYIYGKNVYNIYDNAKQIGTSAFARCETLTSLIIPNSVKSIESRAFYNCSNLTDIVIPDSVTRIGSEAFEYCANLKYNEYENGFYLGNAENPYLVLVKTKGDDENFIINEKTKIIYDEAFEHRTNLKYIKMPDGLLQIGDRAFEECYGLIDVTIPATVLEIGRDIFNSCDELSNIRVESGNLNYRSVGNCLISVKNKAVLFGCNNSVLPVDGSIAGIADEAFAGCKHLTDINIPDGVEYIGDGAFTGCFKLRRLKLPDSLRSVGKNAFVGCALSVLNLPKNLLSLSERAFEGCSLTNISVDPENKVFRVAGNCLINKLKKEVVLGCKTSVIPTDNSVISIGR